ncbi:MAG: recombinase family protein [Chloroflexi bacterium]|nr:recombinase family protein [Chloroflexota bacterium]
MSNQSETSHPPKRAALYARVSSKSQAEDDKVSISEQFAEMEAYCQSQGYETVQKYQDVASGSTKRRPDFQRMLTDARDGRFDVIVCWKADRLSRGIYPAAALMEVVEAHRIGLESVTDTLDMKTFGIFAAVGKIEIDNFRERATLGKRGAAKRGKIPVGNLAYGYRVGEDGKPEIDPVEGPIVQRIFSEYVENGKGAYRIAKQLSLEGVPMAKGGTWGSWSVSQILRILGRETYKGTGWYGRERHITTEEGRKHFSQPEESWISVPFPPLADEATWDRAQTLKVENRSLGKRNTKSVYLLQRLLRCNECGLGFGARRVNRNTVRRGGRTYSYEYSTPARYYVCHGMYSHKLKCREHPYLKADQIEELVWTEVAEVLKHPDVILQGVQAQTSRQSIDELKRRIAEAERELQAVQAEEDRAIRLLVKGQITEEQLNRQRKFITERLEYARAKVSGLRAQERVVREREDLATDVLAWVRQVEVGLGALDPDSRQEILRLVVDSVEIGREDDVRITMAIPIPEVVSDASQQPSCWWRP